MCKILAALVLCLWICGCDDNDDGPPSIEPTKTQHISGGDELRVIEFDGHEYVLVRVHLGGAICHKVNCKFCEN